jgi:hypothetical protein
MIGMLSTTVAGRRTQLHVIDDPILTAWALYQIDDRVENVSSWKLLLVR